MKNESLKIKYLIISLVIPLFVLFFPFGMKSVNADDGDEDVIQTIELKLDDDPVQLNKDTRFYFTPSKTSGYSIIISNIPEDERCRITIYKPYVPSENEVSDGWKYYYEEDYYDGEGEFNFYAIKDIQYKCVVEVSDTLDISIKEAPGKAGLQDGLVWSSFKNNNYDGTYSTAVKIIGFNGADKDVIIPQTINGYNVVNIGDWAFEYSEMESLSISEGVLSYGNGSFYYCNKLKSISFPSTIDNMENAFAECTSLESVTFPNGNENYYVKDHELRSKNGTLIYVFGLKQDEYTVSDDIYTMKPYALNDIGAKKLTISKNVTSLWQLPREFCTEIHIRNANCTDHYAGFPTYYDENYELRYAHVYGPSGGKLEAYCLENDIPFTEEGGKYNPLDPDPFSDPIDLAYGVRQEMSIKSGRGNCQEYIIKPEETKTYSLLVEESIESIESEYETMTDRILYDEDGTIIEPLSENKCFIDSSYNKCTSYQYNLTKGKKYTFIVKIKDELILESFSRELSVMFTNRYKFEVDPNGGYYEDEKYDEELDDYVTVKVFDPIEYYFFICENDEYRWELYGDVSLTYIINNKGFPCNDNEDLCYNGFSFNGGNAINDYSGIVLNGDTKAVVNWGDSEPVPTSTPDVDVTPTPNGNATPSPDVNATPTPSVEVTPTATPSAETKPTSETTATPNGAATATPNAEVTATPSATPNGDATAAPTATAYATATASATPTKAPATATPTKTPTATLTPTPTLKPTATATPTVKPTPTSEPEKEEITAPSTKLKSVKNKKGKKLYIKWAKKSDAKGYQIQYATNKTFTKGKKTKNVSRKKNELTVKGLKKDKTYYVRVRTYVYDEDDEKVYSNWSSKKKVTITK